jgi:hypothetical protein
MSKMGSHDLFGYLKHKLWSKERLRVKLQISLPTTKSLKSPWFPCVQVVYDIPLKTFWRCLQLYFGSQFNQRFTWEVMGLQSCRNPNFKKFGLNLGVPRQNDILVLTLWPGIETNIRGKVVDFLKFGLWWVLWVHQKCFNCALTNLLFGFCRSVWIIGPLIIRPSPHPEALACPSTFEMLQARERTPTFDPSAIFTFEFTIEFIKEFGGVSFDHMW